MPQRNIRLCNNFEKTLTFRRRQVTTKFLSLN